MEHILLKLPLDGSLPTFLSISSSSKQHLRSTYPTPAFSYSRLRPQESYFLLPALRIYFCCALNSTIAGRVFIGILSRRQSTLGAPPSRLQLSPSHFVAQQPRNTAFLRRHPPISALIKQQPV